MKKPLWCLALALSSVLSLAPCLATQGGEPPAAGLAFEAAPLVCGPHRPAAFPGERVTLSAWANVPNPGSLQYAWSIQTGRLTGSGSLVSWHPETMRSVRT